LDSWLAGLLATVIFVDFFQFYGQYYAAPINNLLTYYYIAICRMKWMDSFNNLKPLDIVLAVVFVLYIIMPVETPPLIAIAIQSPLGMLSLFVVALVLFVYTNPLLAVIFIFVAYELMHRSQLVLQNQLPQNKMMGNSYSMPSTVSVSSATATQYSSPEQLQIHASRTLEEDVVKEMAPIGYSDPAMYVATSYQPIREPVGSASLV